MGAPGDERRRENHIRSISRLFLSRRQAELETPSAPQPRSVIVTGRPGSPWPLALAVNLALTAWRRDLPGTLLLPAARLPAVARLLGAGAERMGIDLREGGTEEVASVQPMPGLRLHPVEYHALLPAEGEGWRFIVSASGQFRGPHLGLLEDPEDPLPLTGKGDPLFVLGLGFQPPPRQGVTGVWGPMARHQLLDPGREPTAALHAGDHRLHQRYSGFLEALGRFAATDGRESGSTMGVRR